MTVAIISAAAAAVVGVGVAAQASQSHTAIPKHTVATYQMFANVDAEGDLGSHYDATKVHLNQVSGNYTVTFSKPIGSCAAQAQPGKAGGPDPVRMQAISTVVAHGTKSFDVHFTIDGAGQFEPFMLTVTCHF
ncbi:hypothetical protein [Jatrophihabitans endophyticus]|uniref:hypothetical protein n=1 Tax=Jatrophihabitans endophyticus TaxID=1206085 RepID=UPI0019FD0AB5|nr:hypothetical protein [Jatrophihabitans endophyticus]MBE7189676.1 hypothetical protein [Jatrophihabitans endophyticus]